MKYFITVCLLLSGCSAPQQASNSRSQNEKPPTQIPYVSTPMAFDLSRSDLDRLLTIGTNDADAAFRLHQYYEFTIRDFPQALKWLQTAADLGHVVAIENYESIKKWPGIETYLARGDSRTNESANKALETIGDPGSPQLAP